MAAHITGGPSPGWHMTDCLVAFRQVSRRGDRSRISQVLCGASVDDEEPCAFPGPRAVRLCVVSDLVTAAGAEGDDVTVVQLGGEASLEDEQDVPPAAPVVGCVAGAVVHHSNPYGTELTRSPGRAPGIAWTDGGGNRGPVGDAEGYASHLHERR